MHPTYYQAFTQFLEANRFAQEPSELYEPVNYIMELGGKRIRPILTMMAYRLFQDDLEPVLPAAYTVELFHNFSLVHDDIMDEALLRRGKPSVHIKYNTNTGILSGDVMLIYCYDFLMRDASPEQIPALIQTFNRVATEVCEGQQMDMNFEDRWDVSIEAYLKMIELKTAALLGGCLELGAIKAGAPAEDLERLRKFGRYVGIAFQLQDDVLDTFGDPEKFGKKVGGDIAQNKKTFLVLKSIALGGDKVEQELKQWFADTETKEEEKIAAVRKIFEQVDVKTHANNLKEQYTKQAFDCLHAVGVPEERKQELEGIANQLLIRDY